MLDAVKFSENFNFVETGCFYHKVGEWAFFWKVMDVRLPNAVNFMFKHWRVHNLILGPEAVEVPNMTMLEKIGFVKNFKSDMKKLGDH